MAPFDLSALPPVAYALVFAALGFGFGAVLEMAGFGDTRKLAAQFYLRELTVLKVMFTAIAVAAVLVALASAFGLLDMGRVWVNPTYLWPGVVGGLIMGVGFVVGGFCPGTSLVAAATLKLDGVLFVLGGLFGVWAFGETVARFEPWWLSSFLGRFTLPEWLGLSTGTTVVLVVAMAVAAFAGAGLLERRFGGEPLDGAPSSPRRALWRRAGAAALLLAAAAAALHGEPGAEARWAAAGPARHAQVEARALFADPAEVVALRQDLSVQVEVLDLRSDHDFNLFHVGGARRLDPAALEGPAELRRLLDRPPSTVTFLMGNGEAAALSAWKRLAAQGVTNVYAVEGGVNRWLERYPPPACAAARRAGALGEDELAYRFGVASGARLPSARPELPASRAFLVPCAAAEGGSGEPALARWPAHAYTKRVKLQVRTVVKGGCG